MATTPCRLLRAGLLLCLLWLGAMLPAQSAGLLHLDQAQMMVTPPAQYHPVTSVLDTSALQGPWTGVALPYRIEEQPGAHISSATGKPAGMTTSWYRISLAGLAGTAGPVSLHLLRWQAAGQLAIYGNQHLLYRSPGSAVWNYFRHPALHITLRRTAEAPLPQTLWIRLDTYPGSGAAISSLYAGPRDEVYARYSWREWQEYQLPFMMSTSFLAIGIFSFGVWLVRRREAIYFLVFVIAVCSMVRRWHFFAGLEQLAISDQWFGWLTYNALNWQLVAMQYFAQLLHGREHRWLNRIIVGFAALMTVATMQISALQPGMVLIKPMLYLGPIALGVAVTMFNVWDGWRSHSREARLLGAWLLVSLSFGTYDWLKAKYQFGIEYFFLTPYAAMMMFVVISYILFRRYVQAQAEAERNKEYLALRLQQREAELAESYERLRAIEKSQTLSIERQRLMQDMHDGLGSSLVSALRLVERGEAGKVDVVRVLKSCVDDLKLAIDSMEPVDADLLLLLATLRFRLGPQLQSTGIALEWEVQDVPPLSWLDPRNALHILRILQEVFANIIKHTQATRITVATASEAGQVLVSIRDNGAGFDVSEAMRKGGRGLRNQIRRAEAIGAEISWQSDAGGTCLSLQLPVVRSAGVSQPEPAYF